MNGRTGERTDPQLLLLFLMVGAWCMSFDSYNYFSIIFATPKYNNKWVLKKHHHLLSNVLTVCHLRCRFVILTQSFCQSHCLLFTNPFRFFSYFNHLNRVCFVIILLMTKFIQPNTTRLSFNHVRSNIFTRKNVCFFFCCRSTITANHTKTIIIMENLFTKTTQKRLQFFLQQNCIFPNYN